MSSSSKEREGNRDDIDDNEAARHRASRDSMLGFVHLADLARKRGYMPSPPPLEMFTHPDLLEKAWGWDRLLPFDYIGKHGPNMALYTRYLHQYYSRNRGHSITEHCVTDLDSCAKMEAKLLSLLGQHLNLKLLVNECNLSKKITDIVPKIDYANCSEFPTAPIALKCITMEAQLLCELIESGYGNTSAVATCCSIRKCVLRFMTYKGTQDVIASASMMAIMKEAALMLEFLEKRLRFDDKNVVPQTNFVRNYAAVILVKICPETRVKDAKKLVPVNEVNEKTKLLNYDESNDKNYSTKRGHESQLEKRKEANQNKMETSWKDQQLKGGGLISSEAAEKITAAETSIKEQQLKGGYLISSEEAKTITASETSIKNNDAKVSKEELSKEGSLKNMSNKNIAKISSKADAVRGDNGTNTGKSLHQLLHDESLRSRKGTRFLGSLGC